MYQLQPLTPAPPLSASARTSQGWPPYLCKLRYGHGTRKKQTEQELKKKFIVKTGAWSQRRKKLITSRGAQ